MTHLSRHYTAEGLKDHQIARLLNAATDALQPLIDERQLPQSTRQLPHDAVTNYLRDANLAIDQRIDLVTADG